MADAPALAPLRWGLASRPSGAVLVLLCLLPSTSYAFSTLGRPMYLAPVRHHAIAAGTALRPGALAGPVLPLSRMMASGDSAGALSTTVTTPPRKRPFAAALVSWLARRFIVRSTRLVVGLAIDVKARSNGEVLAGNLPRVQASFEQVVLDSLQITGGGSMEITGLNIKMLTLLIARRLNVIRRPFEIYGEYVLTQRDVAESKLIRDLIQNLVNTVLRMLFPTLHLTFFDVVIEGVRITNDKLAIQGSASIAESPARVPFVLLTGVGLSGGGHVMYLDKPELVLNPEAKLPLKVPLGSIRAFDVDIGDNARIEDITIDDKVGVTIRARTVITPALPFKVSDAGKRAAFLYDIGAFLSSFWGFTHLAEYLQDS